MARLSPVLDALMSVAFAQLVQSNCTCWCNSSTQLHHPSFLRLQPDLGEPADRRGPSRKIRLLAPPIVNRGQHFILASDANRRSPARA